MTSPEFEEARRRVGTLPISAMLASAGGFLTGDQRPAGVESAASHVVNGQSYNSTLTTGNLRTLADAAVVWFLEGKSRAAAQVVRDFSVICAAFLAGAVAGAYTVQTFDNRALWCDVILLTLVAIRVRSRMGSSAILPDTAGSTDDCVQEIPVSGKDAALGS